MKLMRFAFRAKAFLGRVWPVSADLAVPATACAAYKSLLNFLGGSVKNTWSRSSVCLVQLLLLCLVGSAQHWAGEDWGGEGSTQSVPHVCAMFLPKPLPLPASLLTVPEAHTLSSCYQR